LIGVWYRDYLNQSINTIGMNSYPIKIDSWTKSLRKMSQGQLYFDKLNLIFILEKKSVTSCKTQVYSKYNGWKLKPKYKLNNPIYTR